MDLDGQIVTDVTVDVTDASRNILFYFIIYLLCALRFPSFSVPPTSPSTSCSSSAVLLRAMVKLSITPASVRTFPYTGYLGLTPLKLEGCPSSSSLALCSPSDALQLSVLPCPQMASFFWQSQLPSPSDATRRAWVALARSRPTSLWIIPRNSGQNLTDTITPKSAIWSFRSG